MVTISCLSADAFRPLAGSDSVFVDVHSLHPLYEKFYERKDVPLPNIVLSGPKGIAKTLSLHAFAVKKKAPLISADCSADMRRSTMVGYTGIAGDETPFICGPLTTAISAANETGFAMLVLEEINSLSPQAQKLLNPLCDFRKELTVTEAGKVFALKPGARLWVFGTMNAGYGGTHTLNEDLVSRMDFIPLDYPERKQELAIIKANLPSTEVNDTTLGHILTVAGETRTEAMGYALSPRDLVQLVRNIDVVGMKTAFRMVSGKFEGTGLETFKERTNAVFKGTFEIKKAD